jgi:hypothetical protein
MRILEWAKEKLIKPRRKDIPLPKFLFSPLQNPHVKPKPQPLRSPQYPEARVILTTRPSAETWAESCRESLGFFFSSSFGKDIPLPKFLFSPLQNPHVKPKPQPLRSPQEPENATTRPSAETWAESCRESLGFFFSSSFGVLGFLWGTERLWFRPQEPENAKRTAEKEPQALATAFRPRLRAGSRG